MKQTVMVSMALLLVVFLLPLFAVGQPLYEKQPPPLPLEITAEPSSEPSSEPSASSSPTRTPTPVETVMPTQVTGSPDRDIKVRVWDGTETLELRMDEYLLGVLAAEMPASFPSNALEAQACAARTYTAYRMENPPTDGRHPDADVCMDSGHCKAYSSPLHFEEKWGDDTASYTAKLKEAVSVTDGQVVLYDGKPVLAVFHAASSGQTERSIDVWAKDMPYLQSVASPGETESPRYYGRVEMTPQEFRETFSKYYPEAEFSKTPQGWFQNIKRSAAGGVTKLTVAGVTVAGSVLRNMFGLQSTNLTITASAESIIIDTLGYGHGVGMSQYGAAELAREGKTYEEILKWYYTGTEVGPWLGTASGGTGVWGKAP